MKRTEQQGKNIVRSGCEEIKEMFISNTRSKLPFFYLYQKLGHVNIWDQHIQITLSYKPFYKSSWLRHYATSLKVAGSGPDEVDFFFNLPNPSSRIIALGPTQPLTEMSARNLLGG
jgi:hypothetical protein